MPNNRSVCAKCMCPIIDSECGCLDELTASPVERVFMPQTRYRLKYGEHEISFSAPMPETREHLAEILEGVVAMLKAPEDTGEIGFF